jgi:F-type H+-transporting ATPase subunit delta
MKDAAKIYGEALYELAHSESLDGELLPQLRGAAELLAAASEYQYILSSPAISKAERTGLLDQAFAGQVHPYVLNFMKILCEAGAIRLLPSCLRSYERRYNQDNNILKARAVTAVEMTQEQQEALRQKLSTATGKTVRLTCQIDPVCLGGVRVEMDGQRLDGTVRRHLEDMNDLLSKAVY